MLPGMMERGLDHLVYATPDLDASVEELAERLGTEPVAGGALLDGWWRGGIGVWPGGFRELWSLVDHGLGGLIKR